MSAGTTVKRLRREKNPTQERFCRASVLMCGDTENLGEVYNTIPLSRPEDEVGETEKDAHMKAAFDDILTS